MFLDSLFILRFDYVLMLWCVELALYVFTLRYLWLLRV